MLIALLPIGCCVIALLLDRLFGEPKYHPLVLFGNIASSLERRLNNRQSRINGLIAAILVMALPVSGVVYLQLLLSNIWLQSMLNIVVLYFVIGWQSMKQHTLAISNPLLNNDLNKARYHLSMIVSRDTSQMNESQIVGSTIESILENGHDCVFASIFWFIVLGPAGALIHRLTNTLDAMWGYKNEQYCQFGWFSAKLDDWLGYLPARLTGLSYALCGENSKGALLSWRNQMGQHKSPNAGLVMASGAGALGVIVGGPTHYEGVFVDKVYLGVGKAAITVDIKRSIGLVEKSLLGWLLIGSIVIVYLATL
jgi:adenosylcobinamide-phosphate synthase